MFSFLSKKLKIDLAEKIANGLRVRVVVNDCGQAD